MGVGPLRGYNLYWPPDYNPKTRDHKQAAIFVGFADVCSVVIAVKRTCVHEAAASRAHPGI